MMSTTAIAASTFNFLAELKENNHRDWFSEHKDRFKAEQAKIIDFAEQLITEVNKFDVLEPLSGKKSLFRIYRDIRFSKDKTPYKPHFSGQLKRATAFRRGGYYFRIAPNGNTMIAGGFFAPNANDLKRIRQEIAADPDGLRQIISAPAFIDTFGELKGEQVKTAPRGFSKTDPAIDLLRYKQYLLIREFSDEEAMAADFLAQAAKTYQHMLPLFEYMSSILTTDENGAPIEGLY